MNDDAGSVSKVLSRIIPYIPIISWLPKYDRKWLRFDLLAGLTLAAFAIPDGMAYASLAGLPPQYGLYVSIVAPLLYFLFATSRQAVVGASSSEAILLASVLAYPGRCYCPGCLDIQAGIFSEPHFGTRP